MKSRFTYILLGVSVFLLVWVTTHPHIALALFGAPLFGLALGEIYERIVPDFRRALPLHPEVVARQEAAERARNQRRMEKHGKPVRIG